MPEMIPATKVYADFGIPRSVLRKLADDGVVRCEERTFDGGANVLRLYSRSDLERWQNGGGNEW